MLISQAEDFYEGQYMGMKFYTDDKKKVEEFQKSGFLIGGVQPGTPQIKPCYYLKKTGEKKKCYPRKIQKKTQQIETHKIIMEKIEKYKKEKKLYERKLQIVALEDSTFVGGISMTITKDSMYIEKLVVEETYRNNGIGRQLMKMAQEKAEENHVYQIYLGTLEFQAKKFYEKLGFQVAFTKENDPKGYCSYTMVKRIGE